MTILRAGSDRPGPGLSQTEPRVEHQDFGDGPFALARPDNGARGEQDLLSLPPSVVVRRLPVYLRALGRFRRQGKEFVSSEELGGLLRSSPAQVRKDLSYFGRFGSKALGYDVTSLDSELRRVLGLDRPWSVVLVGVGQLGRALLGYEGFREAGFRIAAAFDARPAAVEGSMKDLKVGALQELPAYLAVNEVEIGILAVRAASAQRIANILIAGGVRAILNYAPAAVSVPEGAISIDIDPILTLQAMTFYLNDGYKRPSRSLGGGEGRRASHSPAPEEYGRLVRRRATAFRSGLPTRLRR